MIRAAAISLLCLAVPAIAQTPVPISVANILRTCISDADGTRDAARLAQLERSLATVPNRRWTNKVEVGPGVHRITGATSLETIEIKLPDANGAAYCIVYGPSIAVGQAALSADKFVEMSFLPGLVAAQPPQGVARRYVMQGAPYQIELLAFNTAEVGDVVGFAFASVPQNLTTRSLSVGDPTVTYQNVSAAITNAVMICTRDITNIEGAAQALTATGFQLGYRDGRDANRRTFFSADNAVSVRVSPGTCTVDTKYLHPSTTAQITSAALNAAAPGVFQYRAQGSNGCPGFSSSGRYHIPLYLEIFNVRSQGRSTCIEDGTSRIAFQVAG